MINTSFIAQDNEQNAENLRADFDHLGEKLARRNLDIHAIIAQAAAFETAIPSWGVGTGGTRFARFPGAGEPSNVFDKLEDCAVIHQLTGAAPRVSLHIPWDKAAPSELRAKAEALGIGFDAINSNTFQDQPGQPHSYKFGSLSHTDPATRQQAIEHNIECIELGNAIGSKALTVWIGDGSNFPGQTHFARQFDRYLEALKAVYAALPADWRLFTEHKMYEPAFYSTVVQDWGSSYLAARELGDKAQCLVDLGHHAPNANIEMIVSRLFQFGKLGGFHFNDSKYGDDDLDSGSIDPFRLFLVFNELVDLTGKPGFDPAYMLDQSHNVTDPIESLMCSVIEVQRAYVRALIVDRVALDGYQQDNDAIYASRTLRDAFNTDVDSILAKARIQNGGAVDPVGTYRAAGYRAQVAASRPETTGSGGGIV